VRVAVIDVGSNTVRLLVADWDSAGLETVREERTVVALGEEVELYGEIGPERLEVVARCCRSYAQVAAGLGARRVDVLVTAPGRQADNASELVVVVECATGHAARVLAPLEEGCLAFEGALAAAPELPEIVAVCDVGGGSTEIVVGTLGGGPAWGKSLDIGAVRLTARAGIGDPPSRRELARARDEVQTVFDGVIAPFPQAALATGGSARALRRLVGPVFDEGAFAEALQVLRKRPAREVERRFGIDQSRTRTLPAGVLILAELQRRLVVPLLVSRGGLREGAALQLVADNEAA
jgi:exopolyphosphatase/guanosine-5'-triphosphate,3'-diphosphate pyrophosphatase